jgi:UPF0755 protein
MRRVFTILGIAVLTVGAFFSLPSLFAFTLNEWQAPVSAVPAQFPVTVNPKDKIIVENAEVNALLGNSESPFQAAVLNTGNAFWNIFAWVATSVDATEWYQAVAGVAGINYHLVTIQPGMRKEQAADAFGSALGWNSKQEKEFLTAAASSTLPLPEGSFEPGVYSVDTGMTPAAVQDMVNQKFTEDILSHYGTTTAQIVPLNEALTVASLIQREAAGPDDMRTISGIIWNRLFANMDLQIDATVQYAEANKESYGSWWPPVSTRSLFIKSPYNTYENSGLPPTPIANPSVAAVLAALNPVNTPCMFYFHDKMGQFHCSDTYAEHLALLKKYYGK